MVMLLHGSTRRSCLLVGQFEKATTESQIDLNHIPVPHHGAGDVSSGWLGTHLYLRHHHSRDDMNITRVKINGSTVHATTRARADNLSSRPPIYLHPRTVKLDARRPSNTCHPSSDVPLLSHHLHVPAATQHSVNLHLLSVLQISSGGLVLGIQVRLDRY